MSNKDFQKLFAFVDDIGKGVIFDTDGMCESVEKNGIKYNRTEYIASEDGQLYIEKKELSSLQAKNKLLMEAVEFYGEENNWDLVPMRADGEGSCAPIFCKDHWKAREVLKQIKEGKYE